MLPTVYQEQDTGQKKSKVKRTDQDAHTLMNVMLRDWSTLNAELDDLKNRQRDLELLSEVFDKSSNKLPKLFDDAQTQRNALEDTLEPMQSAMVRTISCSRVVC
ncbi:hypothetical protein DPEC_G00090110 [Dallia pectoralis]|uniref:Uncharacterized protein n=1 Tax=Dallia pectoralis TaxID=75939 RepID=A0ACC2H0X3_DALPE|nr:hypothetical protein DPEC_G00090110 [Dallia pectoralis]